jgi:NADH-quinone oxidoreductase subunit C
VTDAPVETTEESPEEAAPTELHGAPVTSSRGQDVAHPSRETYLDVVRALKDDGFAMCIDVTVVDYLGNPARDLPPAVSPERFELVTNLLSMDPPRRVRLRVQVPAHDPVAPSLFELHPGTEAMEREVFDMFGIRFEGHPDLTRILMPEDWEGHPLRKDYPIGRVPVQFKHPPATR